MKPVSDERLIQFIKKNPGARPRDVAKRFFTVKAQLAVGARLKRLVREGHLAERFEDGWKYWSPIFRSPRETS